MRSKGAKLRQLRVPPETVERFLDFQKASREGPEGQLIGEALEAFIDSELEKNEGIKKQFKALQERRAAQKD